MLYKWWRLVAVLTVVAAMLGIEGECMASPGWPTNYRSALETARREGKPVVIDFGSPTCPACRMLERRTLSHPGVRSALSDFVRVYIDGNEQVSLRESFGVQYYPTLIYLSPEGKVLKRQVGFVGPDEMRSVLSEVAARVPPRLAQPSAVAQASPRGSASRSETAHKPSGKNNFYELAAAAGAKQSASADSPKPKVVETVRDIHQVANVELVAERGKLPSSARGGGEERLLAQALPVPSNVETPKPLVEMAPPNTPAPSATQSQKPALPDAIRKVQSATPAHATPATPKPSPSPTVSPEKTPAKTAERSSAQAAKPASEPKGTPRAGTAEKKPSPAAAASSSRAKEGESQQARSPSQEVTAEDVERWFADAESKLMAGYKKEARAMYAKVVERDPTNKFGKSDLAFIKMVALMVDREDDQLRRAAHAKIKEFLKRYPNSPHKDYYTVVRAMLAADLGDYAEAHALLDRFPEEFPESRYQDLARTVWQELPKDPRSLQKKATPAVAQSSSAKPAKAKGAPSASTKGTSSASKPAASGQGNKATKGTASSAAGRSATASSTSKKSPSTASQAKKPAPTPASQKKSASTKSN